MILLKKQKQKNKHDTKRLPRRQWTKSSKMWYLCYQTAFYGFSCMHVCHTKMSWSQCNQPKAQVRTAFCHHFQAAVSHNHPACIQKSSFSLGLFQLLDRRHNFDWQSQCSICGHYQRDPQQWSWWRISMTQWKNATMVPDKDHSDCCSLLALRHIRLHHIIHDWQSGFPKITEGF